MGAGVKDESVAKLPLFLSRASLLSVNPSSLCFCMITRIRPDESCRNTRFSALETHATDLQPQLNQLFNFTVHTVQ